jgi:hypothetical protein
MVHIDLRQAAASWIGLYWVNVTLNTLYISGIPERFLALLLRGKKEFAAFDVSKAANSLDLFRPSKELFVVLLLKMK